MGDGRARKKDSGSCLDAFHESPRSERPGEEGTGWTAKGECSKSSRGKEKLITFLGISELSRPSARPPPSRGWGKGVRTGRDESVMG